MTQPKQDAKVKQPITLPNGTTLVIAYDPSAPPVIEWVGRYVIVACEESSVPHRSTAVRISTPSDTNGPEVDTPEIAEARRRLLIRHPYTSEDAARDLNVQNPQALSFENLSAIAASLPDESDA